MNLSNPLTSTFRIRPGTLLHDDKREKYFYDMILPLILVHQIWGIGVCTLAPGGPEKHSQWGHQRAFSAGSTMDRSNSWVIGISSEIISCGTPRITAIHEVCPWEPAQSVAECRRRASCSRASKTAASALFCLCWPSLLMFCGMRLFMLLCIIGLALLTYVAATEGQCFKSLAQEKVYLAQWRRSWSTQTLAFPIFLCGSTLKP